MVRQSERQTLLSELQQLVAIAAMTDTIDNDNDEFDPWGEILPLSLSLELYASVLSHRYLNPRRPVLKLPSPVMYILSLDSKRFRQEARMDKPSFYQIVDRIEAHPIFTNSSNNRQAPVHVQLLVFLAKLGRFGNGASVGILARHFGVSEGTVEIFCRRCLCVILSLESQVLYWPESDERDAIAWRIFERHGFKGCLGFVDGTLFSVYAKPSVNSEDYSRKGYYGMAGMVVCDDLKRIIFMDLGWPAAAHDMRVWSNSSLGRDPSKYMRPHEFLLADSGYASNDNVMPSYKKTRGSNLTASQKLFNTRVAQCRSVNEHCIGLLKGRFQSLRGMRLDISQHAAAKRMIANIRVAGVLHNLLLDMSDSGDWDDELYDLDCSNDLSSDNSYMPREEDYSCAHQRREWHCRRFSTNS